MSRFKLVGLRRDRGATLVEYALGVALLCIASLGAIEFLTDTTADELGERSSTAGAPDLDAAGLPPVDPPGGDDSGDDSDGGDEDPGPQPETVSAVNPTGCFIPGNQTWAASLSFDVVNADDELMAGAEATIRMVTYWGQNNGPINSALTTVADIKVSTSSGVLSYTSPDLDGNGNPQVLQVHFELLDITGPGPMTYDVPSDAVRVEVNRWAAAPASPSPMCS